MGDGHPSLIKVSLYLSLATEPPVYTPIFMEGEYIFDISFIGTAFNNRAAFIDSISEYLVTKNILIIGYNWDRLKSYELLKEKILLLPFLVYENNIEYYKRSEININIHRSIEDVTFNRNRVKINADVSWLEAFDPLLLKETLQLSVFGYIRQGKLR